MKSEKGLDPKKSIFESRLILTDRRFWLPFVFWKKTLLPTGGCPTRLSHIETDKYLIHPLVVWSLLGGSSQDRTCEWLGSLPVIAAME